MICPVRSRIAEKQVVSGRAAGDHDVKIGRALNNWDETAGLQRVQENLGAVGSNSSVRDGYADKIDFVVVAKKYRARELFIRNPRSFENIFLQTLSSVAALREIDGTIRMKREDVSLRVWPDDSCALNSADNRID